MDQRVIASEGDKITFHRHGFGFTGEVVKVREESVLVSISQQDAEQLNIDTPITVVSHKHYDIVHLFC
jgi:uncharacterized protein YkvS